MNCIETIKIWGNDTIAYAQQKATEFKNKYKDNVSFRVTTEASGAFAATALAWGAVAMQTAKKGFSPVLTSIVAGSTASINLTTAFFAVKEHRTAATALGVFAGGGFALGATCFYVASAGYSPIMIAAIVTAASAINLVASTYAVLKN